MKRNILLALVSLFWGLNNSYGQTCKLNKSKLFALDSLGKKIGYITGNNCNAENTGDRKAIMEDELAEEEATFKENKGKRENALIEKKETGYYQSRVQEAERNIKRLKKVLRRFMLWVWAFNVFAI